MAKDVANDIVYWMEIEKQHKDFLGSIRHWENLKTASNENSIWIKDFTDWQLRDSTLQSIPFTRFYYCRDNLLFPKGSLLPQQKQPSFLWTPIQKAFPVTIEAYNHNFFGVQQRQTIRLITTETEQQATVLLVDIEMANKYIHQAPAIRLQHLRWLLVNGSKALFVGAPMLPLNGDAFWQKGNFIFPVGYSMEFPILENQVKQIINADGDALIWWTNEHAYSLIKASLLQPLSIASWRQTILNEPTKVLDI